MLQHIVLISCCLLAIGDSNAAAANYIFLSQPPVATGLVTAQDTVTLQPVLPASGLSACPGQDVTLNCTVVRADTTMDPPLMTWNYRNIYGIRSDGSSTFNSPQDIFTATFAGSYTLISTATILSVPLSLHSSEMRCQTGSAFKSVTITITGNYRDCILNHTFCEYSKVQQTLHQT